MGHAHSETARGGLPVTKKSESPSHASAAGGFDCTLFVGYEATPDDGVDPMLCFVCNPGSR